MLQWISALPDNVVNNIFTTINTLICGLIVAFFTSTFLKKKEEQLFHGLEDKYAFHKLWLDTKVREHLAFMLIYFGYFNTIPLMVKRIPLPVGQELTDEEIVQHL